ncbi:MAG TPA: phosphoribosylformylglycinamidine synthase subunit PurS [Deltaproteobacteria bacterium]|nr:phosphoribosylformylglycinamidine synthase subunit PurS [Deltaproteobacteria bacterium]
MKARVYVTLKKGVLDPQGKAVMGALKALSFDEVREVRIGKLIEIELDGASREEEEARLREMCEKLLANPVMEDFGIEIED